MARGEEMARGDCAIWPVAVEVGEQYMLLISELKTECQSTTLSIQPQGVKLLRECVEFVSGNALVHRGSRRFCLTTGDF